MWLRESLKYVGGLLLAGGLLWWVLHGTDPQELWSRLRDVSVSGLLAAAVLSIGHNVFRVLRWRALLAPVRPGVRFRSMFDAVILGYTISWVIPGRLGEFVRPALLSGRERLPLGPCLGSVLADRLLDGIAVVGLFAVGFAVTPLTGEAAEHAAVVRASALGLVALISVPILVLLVASFYGDRLRQWFSGRGGWRGWLGRTLLALSQGVDSVKQPALLAWIALHTILAWLTIAAATWVGLLAVGVDLTFGGTLVLLPLLALGIALPTPGGAGGYHAAMRFGLIELFRVETELAVGAGLLLHAVSVVPVVLFGGTLLVVDRSLLGDVLRAARQVRDMGAAPPPVAATGPAAERPS
jgi:uncharacterized protein (TIRG00374 family)